MVLFIMKIIVCNTEVESTCHYLEIFLLEGENIFIRPDLKKKRIALKNIFLEPN